MKNSPDQNDFHKSVIVSLERFRCHLSMVELCRLIFADESQELDQDFFNDYIQARISEAAETKEEFLQLSIPRDKASKAIIAASYLSLLFLFPDSEIKKRMVKFGVPRNLGCYSDYANLINELDTLKTSGIRVKKMQAFDVCESLLRSFVPLEVAEIFGFKSILTGEIRQATRNDKKRPHDSFENLPATFSDQLRKEVVFLQNSFGSETMKARFKKIGLGKDDLSYYKLLSGLITKPEAMNSNEFYRKLAGLTCILSKKRLPDQEQFLWRPTTALEKSKNTTRYYNTEVSRWVKKIWTKR